MEMKCYRIVKEGSNNQQHWIRYLIWYEKVNILKERGQATLAQRDGEDLKKKIILEKNCLTEGGGEF